MLLSLGTIRTVSPNSILKCAYQAVQFSKHVMQHYMSDETKQLDKQTNKQQNTVKRKVSDNGAQRHER